jgi:anti-sigma regulatory factor (Ser/Thr protein kinase)
MILAGPQRPADHISKPLTLGAIPTSPRTARAAARSLLVEWGLTGLADSVELIATELVTNAVQVSVEYTVPPPVEFRMSATRTTVLIEVWDYDPRQPVIRRPGRLDEDGRGLLLVATVSARWGWTMFQRGKIVWAEVR